MFKSYYLVDSFQNQRSRYFDFEQNWWKNDQILIEATLRLELVICFYDSKSVASHEITS